MDNHMEIASSYLGKTWMAKEIENKAIFIYGKGKDISSARLIISDIIIDKDINWDIEEIMTEMEQSEVIVPFKNESVGELDVGILIAVRQIDRNFNTFLTKQYDDQINKITRNDQTESADIIDTIKAWAHKYKNIDGIGIGKGGNVLLDVTKNTISTMKQSAIIFPQTEERDMNEIIEAVLANPLHKYIFITQEENISLFDNIVTYRTYYISRIIDDSTSMMTVCGEWGKEDITEVTEHDWDELLIDMNNSEHLDLMKKARTHMANWRIPGKEWLTALPNFHSTNFNKDETEFEEDVSKLKDWFENRNLRTLYNKFNTLYEGKRLIGYINKIPMGKNYILIKLEELDHEIMAMKNEIHTRKDIYENMTVNVMITKDDIGRPTCTDITDLLNTNNYNPREDASISELLRKKIDELEMGLKISIARIDKLEKLQTPIKIAKDEQEIIPKRRRKEVVTRARSGLFKD